MHECQVGLILFGIPADITCRAPADRYYRFMCLHEHLYEGWVCAYHAGHPGQGICLPCTNTDGHHCPLGITETSPA